MTTIPRSGRFYPGTPVWEKACTCEACGRVYLFPLVRSKDDSGGRRRCRECRLGVIDSDD